MPSCRPDGHHKVRGRVDGVVCRGRVGTDGARVYPEDHPQRPVDIRRLHLVHTLTSLTAMPLLVRSGFEPDVFRTGEQRQDASATMLRGVPRCVTQSRSGSRWARRDGRSAGVSGGSPAAARGHPSAAPCPHAYVFDRVAATDAAGAANSRAPVCGGSVGTDGARGFPEDHPQRPSPTHRVRLLHTLTASLLRRFHFALESDQFWPEGNRGRMPLPRCCEGK